MEKCVRYVFWIVYICLLVIGDCDSLASWDMHDLCGVAISRFDFAGEVSFDAEQLPYEGKVDDCTITITPETLNQNGANMVSFYFTTFDFQSSCPDLNVTVRDGSRGSESIVQGLPQYLCGFNSSLTEQTFSTRGGSIFIHVNVKKSRSLYVKGTFALKFVTYHTGSCHDSEVHKCSNGHCIPQVFNCSDNTRACGDVDEECADDQTLGNDNWFTSLIRYGFIIVASLCILCLLKKLMKKASKKCSEVADCFHDCFGNVRRKCRNCTNSIKISSIPKPRLPSCIRRRMRSNNPDDSTNTSDTITSIAITNPVFSRSNEQINQITAHSPPPFSPVSPEMTSRTEPPSYEDVMASSNTHATLHTDDHAPPYEEIVTYNTDVTTHFQNDEFLSNSRENIRNDETVSLRSNEPSNERIMSSNEIIQSSLPTDSSSILNDYLTQFGIELSDEYSSDPDWDSLSNSSNGLSEQTTETQSASNVNTAAEEDAPLPPPPAYDEAVPPPYYYDYIANVGQYR